MYATYNSACMHYAVTVVQIKAIFVHDYCSLETHITIWLITYIRMYIGCITNSWIVKGYTADFGLVIRLGYNLIVGIA